MLIISHGITLILFGKPVECTSPSDILILNKVNNSLKKNFIKRLAKAQKN